MTETISKSEAARRWDVTPAAVAKYVAKGMPVRPDGKLEWSEVDKWRRRTNVAERSGSWRARQTQPAKRDQRPELRADATAIDLLREIQTTGMRSLCGITEALGLPPVSREAAVYIAAAWIASVAGEKLMAECPTLDYSGLDDVALSAKEESEVDSLVTTAEEALATDRPVDSAGKRRNEK